MARILIIDDDALVRNSLTRLFADMGHEVLPAGSLAQGREAADGGVDVVYLDLDLPDGDGLAAIDDLAASPGRPEVIVITGMGAGVGARRSMQSSAWDYISKPASPQAFRNSLRSALQYRQGARRDTEIRPDFDPCGIAGEDVSMRRTLEDVEKAARSEAWVLLTGETGVGKELTARAIHANSQRRGGPFVVVDCSNMTDTLVESMLYGHVKGAFTGAHVDRQGLVAEANGGTLFLDEVGELPLSIQKSFLRVLQERRFRPVGSQREQSSDFRLVAATNRDLNAMVVEGAFRSDLLFRIRTVDIVVPPLRERGDDRQRLAAHFVGRICGRYGLPLKELSSELYGVVDGYGWPGNVRELANVMEAAVVNAGQDPVIYPKHLSSHVRLSFLDEAGLPSRPWEPVRKAGRGGSGGRAVMPSYQEHKAERDREYFGRLLEAVGHDIPRASRVSGLSVPSVYRHLSLAGIPTRKGTRRS